jgi:hypothetical protein
MATAQTIINRALRLCSVLDPVEAANNEYASDALDTLNGMLAEWYAAGIGFPDWTFPTLATAIATDAGDADALSYQLALRLAPEYGVEIPQALLGIAAETMGRLRLRYFQPGTVDFSELPGSAGVWDIITDSFR